MLFYPAALPLSQQTLTYVAGIIRRRRTQIGSPWRKLNSGRQALLVLAYLRKGETFADLATGFGLDRVSFFGQYERGGVGKEQQLTISSITSLLSEAISGTV